MTNVSIFSIVVEDEPVRESVDGLLNSVGPRLEAFALAVDLLACARLEP